MNHLNEGPERDLEPKKTCKDCDVEAGYLVMDMCPSCFNIAKADYEMGAND
jgi:hypothetical protein